MKTEQPLRAERSIVKDANVETIWDVLARLLKYKNFQNQISFISP